MIEGFQGSLALRLRVLLLKHRFEILESSAPAALDQVHQLIQKLRSALKHILVFEMADTQTGVTPPESIDLSHI